MKSTKRNSLRVCITVLLILATLFSSSVFVANARQITVLGQYAQWQSEGLPQGVREVFYSTESEKLVVVLEANNDTLAKQILQGVSDPEHIEIRFAGPGPAETEEAASAERWKGVLALAGGYFAAMACVVLFMVSCFRRKKIHTDKGASHINRFFGGS